MKKNNFFSYGIILLSLAVCFISCKKEITSVQNLEMEAPGGMQMLNGHKAPTNVTLAVLYVERMLRFTLSLNPSADPTGSLQSLEQPFTDGIYLLGGGDHTPKSHNFRDITIPAGYTHVFAPMIFSVGWFSDCDPDYLPSPGQTDEEFLSQDVVPYLNHPITLECKLGKKRLIRGNYQQYRVTSPAITSPLHASWSQGYGTCGENGHPFPATWLMDGYWVLIPIPDDNFTLEIGGGINMNAGGLKSGIFGNDVTYRVTR